MKRRIFVKLAFAFVAGILVAALVVDYFATLQLERAYLQSVRAGLEEKARLLADWLPAADVQRWAHRAGERAGVRVTWIAPDGTVLADSEAQPGVMENHAGRPEVAAALAGRVGASTRFSHTVRTSFHYVAIPLERGGALRLAYPLAELDRNVAALRRRVLLGSGVAVAAALLLATALAAPIAQRLNRVVEFANALAQGRFDSRLPVHGSDEMSLVMAALNQTADRLEESFARMAQSSRQLEAVLEAMEEGVLAVDSGGRVLFANRALRGLLGAETPPEMTAALDRARRDHTAGASDLRLGSPPRWLKLSCAPMPDGAVAVLYDVTELERLEQMRRDFVANVSHELRTPLTSIQGYAETLQESGLVTDERAGQFVEIIRKHAGRMAKLTADLLTLSRIELGRHEFHFAPVPAADLVDPAIQSVQHVADARGIELALELAADLHVIADNDAIHQVLLNLLDNALKYTAAGRVTVSTRPVREAVEFGVSDTGAGIAREHLPRLFERFYRVDKARSRELGGTGLGLSIVKHIVRAHGGEVRVESKPGRGSSFFFTLPAAAVGAVAEAR